MTTMPEGRFAVRIKVMEAHVQTEHYHDLRDIVASLSARPLALVAGLRSPASAPRCDLLPITRSPSCPKGRPAALAVLLPAGLARRWGSRATESALGDAVQTVRLKFLSVGTHGKFLDSRERIIRRRRGGKQCN